MTAEGARLALGIPARNAIAHLPRLLRSVSEQTEPFDEIWLYDDASSDDTGRLAREFGASVVRSDVNTGPSIGKNVIARRATAEWIHFHDADEALRPEFVARAKRRVRDGGFDVLLFNTQDRDDASGAVLGGNQWDAAAVAADPIRYGIEHTVTNCGVYHRQRFLAAGGFDTDDSTKYNEDQAMHLRLALAGLRFRVEDYTGIVVYRRMHSMSSGHPIECARAHYHVLEQVAARTGRTYATELGRELWLLAGVSGTYLDWSYVRQCISLARDLGYVDPTREHPLFRAIARISPVGAIALREHFVRWFKPTLRASVPRVA